MENQFLRDEIARLKDLPPCPPFRPSCMDKTTDPKPYGGLKKKLRGTKRDMDRVLREQILAATVQQSPTPKDTRAAMRAS